MSKDEQLTDDAMAALRARFQQQSRKAQAYYAVMHEVRGLVGSDDAANSWMNQALPAFGGRTAAQLVGEGRENEVLAHIRTLRT
ncbi:antitoxin Xre/MbcA/ParS toxin-binding domain-containing protein [Massilia niastensis]|uniref:antitoxin Xre/MbcA/ParS toxin-binding domain-containing protein n=1 Tax=Massilia niastensis TaxID=544911 RepID=UPI0012EBFA41|nr:antitoxin Xre/MbcA/ParS toxin-binding domain-containing protein [Massilia niastensis]